MFVTVVLTQWIPVPPTRIQWLILIVQHMRKVTLKLACQPINCPEMSGGYELSASQRASL